MGALPDRAEVPEVLELVAREALAFLEGVDERPVRAPGAAEAARSFARDLPDTGDGAVAALTELLERGLEANVASVGPRCFHLVIGGATPAALGADWITGALDPLAYAWVSSPLAVELERVVIGWLRELFYLPAEGGGILVTGASMANFVGLAAARQWWGDRHGVDVAERGLAGLPPVPVLASGFLHASALKALAMLGAGRSSVRKLARDAAGRADLDAMRAALEELGGAPAIVVATAGEVNAGEFDPIAEMADLAEEHGAWLHVDGAFGLFARVAPDVAHLATGVERADSIASDAHKWLNVPYDCGFALVRQPELLARAFTYDADYLPRPDDAEPVPGSFGPESSRRARSLAVWATLRAYGRAGVRAVVERNLELARRMAAAVDAAPDLERLADVPLNVVCFRYRPQGQDEGGLAEEELDRLNAELGRAIIADGRYYVGTTAFEGRTALRPALSNWRTRPEDVDGFVRVVRELGAATLAQR